MLKTKTKQKNKEDYRVRVPRPLGFTYQAILLNNHKNQERTKEYNTLLNQLKERTIELYTNNNMELNGKVLNITELSQYLNIKTEQTLRMMNKEIERISGFFDGKDGKRLARVNFLGCLKKGLEIQARVTQQTDILMAQQGAEYVPFLTGEVNRSLTNLINAQKPIQELLKMLTEKNTTNIIINADGDSHTSGQHYISPEQALQMIDNIPSLLGNKEAIELKETELGLLPDVNARNQDLSKIGVRIPAKIDKIYMRGDATQKSNNVHNNRPDRVPNEVIEDTDLIA